jgi:rRNA maturation protein Nop10
MGRVDRLGSPNSTVFGINFWPSENINTYLNLQNRIEQRMATMKLAGAEVHSEFSDTFKLIAEDASLEAQQNAKMLAQMQSTWDDIEVNDQSLGFDDLSLEVFRQELLVELRSREAFYKAMPRGVYTGFKSLADTCPQSGMIALLGYPTKKSPHQPYKGYELIYINEQGQNVLLNQKEVLQALNQHKDEERYVEQAIDHGDSQAAQKLADTLQRWLKLQTVTEEVQEDGTVKVTAGKATLDMLKNIKQGNSKAIAKVKTEATPTVKFDADNMDLIAWFVVS